MKPETTGHSKEVLLFGNKCHEIRPLKNGLHMGEACLFTHANILFNSKGNKDILQRFTLLRYLIFAVAL